MREQQKETVELSVSSGLDLTPGHPPLATQVLRFGLTGGLSAIVDFGLLVLLMLIGLPHTPAKAVSFIFGTMTSYVINRRWTFRAGPSTRRFVAFVALYGVTFFVQVGLFTLLFAALRDQLPLIGVQLVSFVLAQGLATTVNFVVQRGVIFRHAHVVRSGRTLR